MATRLAIREKQLETWTAIIQECRNSGMKTKDWLAENNISKDQYYYWFKQLRLAACMQASGPQPELPVESEKPQIVKLECADYQNDHDSCSSSKIRIDRGSIHIEIAGSAAPAVIRSIMEVLVDAEWRSWVFWNIHSMWQNRSEVWYRQPCRSSQIPWHREPCNSRYALPILRKRSTVWYAHCGAFTFDMESSVLMSKNVDFAYEQG